MQCAKLSSLHPRSRPPHAHSTHAQSTHSHISSSCMSASLAVNWLQKAEQRVKNTCAETLIPYLDRPGAPHASLPSSCALGRQRVQKRDLIGTSSSRRNSSSSGSTTSSACLLRTQSNQENLMRNKLPGCTSRRLHSCCPCMLLHDSVQLRCPRHATSHRSIYRRGGTRRWLLTRSSCLLGHVVCLNMFNMEVQPGSLLRIRFSWCILKPAVICRCVPPIHNIIRHDLIICIIFHDHFV